jgi:hypothetical protein
MIETASLEQAADAFVRITQEEMHEYVIETKERRNYRDPSNLYPGGDGRGFGRELSA